MTFKKSVCGCTLCIVHKTISFNNTLYVLSLVFLRMKQPLSDISFSLQSRVCFECCCFVYFGFFQLVYIDFRWSLFSMLFFENALYCKHIVFTYVYNSI